MSPHLPSVRRTGQTLRAAQDLMDPSLDDQEGTEPQPSGEPAGASSPPGFGRRMLQSKVNVACLVYLALLVLVAVLAPLIAPQAPQAQDLAERFKPPLSPDHLLGTDQLGRDTFSRLVYAARVSLIAPLIAVAVAFVLGVPFGLLAGYLGGAFDWLVSRVADALIALPALVLALALVGVLGPSLTNAMIAVGVAYAPRLLRVVRGATLVVREETYVEASRVVGCSTSRLMFFHVLPNVRSPLLVQLSLLMGGSLLAEASLSFLGLGVQPPDASWGSMLRTAFENNFSGPWLAWFPGLAIVVTVLSFNLLGDGIRDAVGRARAGQR